MVGVVVPDALAAVPSEAADSPQGDEAAMRRAVSAAGAATLLLGSAIASRSVNSPRLSV